MVAAPQKDPAVDAPMEAEEAHPTLAKLEELDSAYMSLEKEYQKKAAALAAEYTAKQEPYLEQRSTLLKDAPVPNFWLEALKNTPSVGDLVEEHDEEVLSSLTDITKNHLSDESGLDAKGFQLHFRFAENEYFTNEVLTMTYNTVQESEYLADQACGLIKCETPIEWKQGKDVTVTLVQRKKKGGGAKKKAPAPKMEPRESFFRWFFRTIDVESEEGCNSLKDLIGFMNDEEDPEQLSEACDMLKEDGFEKARILRDTVVPFAYRWYTGEALPIGDDDEFDPEDFAGADDESGDSDESNEDVEEKLKKKKEMFSGDAAKSGKTEEECKQQ